MIIDEDESTRQAIDALLHLEGFVPVSVADSHSLCHLPPNIEVSAIILSNSIEGGSGLELLEKIKSVDSSIPIFVVLERDSASLAVAAMKAGASDAFVKPVQSDRLMEAIRRELSQRMASLEQTAEHSDLERMTGLTEREREVLGLVIDGHTNREIAKMLGISSRTVDVHRAKLLAKMSARNTAELVRKALAR